MFDDTAAWWSECVQRRSSCHLQSSERVCSLLYVMVWHIVMSTNGRITLFVTIITVDNNSIHVVVMSLSCCKHHGGYKKHFKTIIKTADPLNHQLFFLFNSIWQHYSTVIIDFRLVLAVYEPITLWNHSTSCGAIVSSSTLICVLPLIYFWCALRTLM